MEDSRAQRVLLADDDVHSRRLIGRYLSNWGFEVLTASDGLQAIEILEADDAPSLALIDWIMPGIEGVEVCSRVRSQVGRPYIYLILLTAKSDKVEIAGGLESGADDYVVKPCDLIELHARLRVGQRVVSLERTLSQQVIALRESLNEVRQLKELLPICAWCKRVRDDEDYWHTIEEYLHAHTGTDFTHGICPGCLENLRSQLEKGSAG